MSSSADPFARVASWCFVLAGIFAVLGGLSLAAPWVAATVIAVFCGVTLLAVQGAYDQTADAAGNTYDVYVSAKCTGPIYIDGSTDSDNGFWLDRVIPVRESPAGHGPDR